MRAIRVARPGGPDVLELVEAPVPQIGPNQLLVQVEAAGVNFIDIYVRRGTYPVPMPYTPGGEGIGIVSAIGEGVSGFAIGDRVAWTGGKGSYAEFAVVPAATTAILPDTMSSESGFVMAQGLTAHYLAHDIVDTGPGTTALVHAAAGGVGSLLTRILKIRGARVIAIVSAEAKRETARRAGADDIIISANGDFAPAVRDLTAGRGVDVVLDSIGAPTITASLASVRRRGTLVLYGTSGGAVDSISVAALSAAGSVCFIRPGLPDYIATREAFQARVDDLFGWVIDGRLVVGIGGRFPLEQASQAHRALESRASTGKLILTVEEGQKR